MAKVYDSLLAGSSGRVGRVVIANLYGQDILKHRPRKRTKPPTPKQLMVQQRMKLAVSFMYSYKQYSAVNYGIRVGMRSRYNLAMSNVMENMAIDYTNETITTNYASISFSKGNLLGAIPLVMDAAVPNLLQVNWIDNSGSNVIRGQDQGHILIAIEGETETQFFENAAIRSLGTYTINLFNNPSGKTYHAWLAFTDPQSENGSNSIYLGSILIP